MLADWRRVELFREWEVGGLVASIMGTRSEESALEECWVDGFPFRGAGRMTGDRDKPFTLGHDHLEAPLRNPRGEGSCL